MLSKSDIVVVGDIKSLEILDTGGALEGRFLARNMLAYGTISLKCYEGKFWETVYNLKVYSYTSPTTTKLPCS